VSSPAPPALPQRIDVHHHFAPPAWLEAVQGRPLLQAANSSWSARKSLDDMERGEVAAAVLSITNPGLWFGEGAASAQLARACNEHAAKLVSEYPGRFGFFAAVPLPDVDAALAEIEYACGALRADGIGLFTSYGDIWLGHPRFVPVLAELERRAALVHVHPTAADCCRELGYAPGLSPAAIEYGTDTTRAIAGLCFSGDARRFPSIRWIWSHAGGTLPFLAGRLENAASAFRAQLPDGLAAELRRFHYDVAGAANAGALASLLQLVKADRILFGTDFPPGGTAAGVAQALREVDLFGAAELRAVERDNALRLLPRLKARQ
jgi:predicted TIM-barrel fold metal-dependent hydrolase